MMQSFVLNVDAGWDRGKLAQELKESGHVIAQRAQRSSSTLGGQILLV
jgi:hypothetical protein